MPRIVDHAQRRTEIITALWAVIGHSGIEGVTYQAVARAGGISIGRVQHYFSSKEELVLAGCRALVDLATARHEAGAAERSAGGAGSAGSGQDPDPDPDPTQDPWAELLALLTGPIPRDEGFRLGSAVWYAYLVRGVVDPAIGAVVAEAERGTVDTARDLLAAAGADPAAATRLAALSSGLAQRAQLIRIRTRPWPRIRRPTDPAPPPRTTTHLSHPHRIECGCDK